MRRWTCVVKLKICELKLKLKICELWWVDGLIRCSDTSIWKDLLNICFRTFYYALIMSDLCIKVTIGFPNHSYQHFAHSILPLSL